MEKTITVLGAGSWGTALSLLLVNNRHRVILWGHEKEHIQRMKDTHTNSEFLPGIDLPAELELSADLEKAITQADLILVVVPSHAFSEVIHKLKPFWNVKQPIICATKGLDADTGDFLFDVVWKILGKEAHVGILSGPSFAKEVARGLPAAVAIASNDAKTAQYFQQLFHGEKFRVYPTQDLVGVSICGASKNVLAIATGIAEGLGLGANTRAALITRGIAEIMRLAEKLGAKRETVMGLAGLGDLILTCTDLQSRNFRFGVALGQGLSIADSLQKVQQVVEGMSTSFLLQKIAKEHQVDMPIIEQVTAVLNREKTPSIAMKALLTRPPAQF